MGVRYRSLRRAVQTGLRGGLYGLVAGLTLAAMLRALVTERLGGGPAEAPAPPSTGPHGPLQ